jgi:hypothetical protein
MPVRITKPEINLREIINELDKQTGVAGEAMLRAETPQEQFNLIGAGRRNLVMNGGFDVWQRGTTVTTASNSYTSNFTADRWSAYFAGTYTQQQTTLPNGDYVNYFRGVLGTTGSNRININHFIENGNSIMSGKYITVSFWLKASVIDSQVNVKIQTTSGSTFSSYTIIANKYIETSLDWKKYEITLRCNNDIANIGARAHGLLEIDGVDGSWANGTTFEIAQVQMELGKVATPFEHRSYGEELALCQRYCYVIGHPSQVIYLGTGSMYTTTAVNLSVPLPVQLRHNSPSFTRVANGTGNWLNVYVGATGTLSNAAPLQGDYTQSNMRIYIPGAHSGSSPSAAGAGVWSMVLAGAQLIINAEL